MHIAIHITKQELLAGMAYQAEFEKISEMIVNGLDGGLAKAKPKEKKPFSLRQHRDQGVPVQRIPGAWRSGHQDRCGAGFHLRSPGALREVRQRGCHSYGAVLSGRSVEHDQVRRGGQGIGHQVVAEGEEDQEGQDDRDRGVDIGPGHDYKLPTHHLSRQRLPMSRDASPV